MSTRVIAGLALLTGVWFLRRGGDEPSPPPHRAQVAVLADGFAVLTSGREARRIVELDRDGRQQHEMSFRLAQDIRLVGTRAGTTVGWQDGKKVALALLDSDGNLDDKSSWGKKVQRLCDGAATNEHRFGIGWLESDGRVWFVHGPVGRTASDEIAASSATPHLAKVTWCGIASADDNVALLWREGSRLLMSFCTRKACSGLVVKVPIGDKDALLGYGCVRDSCLFATRDRQGATKLHRVTERGRAIVKTLARATADTTVSIVGAGSRAFVVAYIAEGGLAAIHRVTVDGTLTDVRHFDDTAQPPSLAWAGDKLLVAMQSGAWHVLALPR